MDNRFAGFCEGIVTKVVKVKACVGCALKMKVKKDGFNFHGNKYLLTGRLPLSIPDLLIALFCFYCLSWQENVNSNYRLDVVNGRMCSHGAPSSTASKYHLIEATI